MSKNAFYTNPAAIREMLNNVDTTGISIDARLLMESLQEIADHVDPAGELGHTDVHLCDLETCFAYTLWSGPEDVEHLLTNLYDEDPVMRYLSEEELSELIEKIVSEVSWDDDRFTDCSGGNEAICEAIEKVFSDHIRQKPFCFNSDIYHGDHHYAHWYGELFASDFLVDKLQNKALTADVGKLLCMDPPPEFYATYSMVRGTVSVYSRFTLNREKGRMSDTVTVPLTTGESDLLIACIENACRQLHNGKGCLTVLNEAREKEGMSPLKQSLVGKIRFTQNVNGSTSTVPDRTDSVER